MFVGLPATWRVRLMLECGFSYLDAANISIMPPSPTGTRKMVLSTRFSLPLSFYNELRIGKPFELVVEPGPVTCKTFILRFRAYYSERPSKELFISDTYFGFIDLQKKKLTEIDQQYRREEVANFTPFRVVPEPVPSRHFRWRTQVRHSDDHYLSHVGNAGFFQFSLDGAAVAVQEGFMRHFKGDLFDYPVRQVDMVFQSQGFQGDDLDVLVWENGDEAKCLSAQIVRGTEQINFAKFYFYTKGTDNF